MSSFNAAQIRELPVFTPDGTVRYPNSLVQGTSHRASTHPSSTDFVPALPLDASAPLEMSAPLEGVVLAQNRATSVASAPASAPVVEPRPAATSEPAAIEPQPPIANYPVRATSPLPATSNRTIDEERLQILEERLVVDKQRRKIGEVIVRKEIETEMVQVPVRRERLIIEQINPERKQLASIDLRGGDLSGIELAEARDSRLSAMERSNNPEVVLTTQAASQLLAELANQPGYAGARVKIEFEDTTLQDQYRQRLHQVTHPNL